MPLVAHRVNRNPHQDAFSRPVLIRFAIALAASIVLGIFLAWTPRFWGVAAFESGVLLTAIAWLFAAKDFSRFSIVPFVFAGITAFWGWLQSFVLGSATPSSTRTSALEWTVASIGLCVATQLFRSTTARDAFLSIVMWAATAFSILAILQMNSSPDKVLWIFPAQPYAVGTFVYKNQFAAMIELTIPIALYWMLIADRQSAGLFAFLALFAGSIASGSRAGFSLVVLEGMTALLVVSRKKNLKHRYLVVIAPVIALVLGMTALVAGNQAIWSHFQEAHHDPIRPELLKSTLQMYKHEPWSGYGLQSWSTIYPQYATFDVGRFANAAHNDWAEWAAEGGIIFVGSIFGLLAYTLKQAVTSVWGLGVISIMLHSWVDYPTREPVLCVLWFCLAGALLAKRNTAPEIKPAE